MDQHFKLQSTVANKPTKLIISPQLAKEKNETFVIKLLIQ